MNKEVYVPYAYHDDKRILYWAYANEELVIARAQVVKVKKYGLDLKLIRVTVCEVKETF